MKLLVSVVNPSEARRALKGGADIIDVKNPREGALGASYPRIIKEVKNLVHREAELSATIGDLPNLPGTSSLAALGAAALGVDYVKAGLYGVSTLRDSLKLAREICRAVREVSSKTKVILAGYADYLKIRSVEPMKVVEVAGKVGADGVLVDVKSKGLSNVFDYLGVEYLGRLAEKASSLGLLKALAGGLTLEHLDLAFHLGFDVVGVRRAACRVRSWTEGRVDEDMVRKLAEKVKRLK